MEQNETEKLLRYSFGWMFGIGGEYITQNDGTQMISENWENVGIHIHYTACYVLKCGERIKPYIMYYGIHILVTKSC